MLIGATAVDVLCKTARARATRYSISEVAQGTPCNVQN